MNRLKIDMHTHIFPEHLPRFSEKFGYDGFIHLDHHRKGFARMMQGNKFFREIAENCWNPQVRIDEYAKFGVQIQVICTIPVMFCYWANPEHGLEVSQFLNDDLAQVTHKYSQNYLGLGTIPMQDTELAIQELERCKNELGFAGIQIGSNVNDENLNEDKFFPIFEACQDLDMAIMVHPWNMMGKEYMEKYWLPWLVGMPAETSRAVCSMIFGGIFERLPKLRVNFSHAGGSFLPTIGRVEHGYNCRPDLVAIDNNVNPREYLGKFWVDCITHDPVMLEYIIGAVGEDKVTLGSDYPFPLGDLEIGAFIEEMNLSDEVRNKIYCDNILDWLGIPKEQTVKSLLNI